MTVVLSLIGLLIGGVLVHEGGHLAFARLFGGEPFVRDWWPFNDAPTVAGVKLALPVQVDLRTPEALSDWQVRLTGGFVIAFLPILGIALWFNRPFLAAFAGGAAAVSAKDAIAASHPAMWQDLTAGRPVVRAYWEEGAITSRADAPSEFVIPSEYVEGDEDVNVVVDTRS